MCATTHDTQFKDPESLICGSCPPGCEGESNLSMWIYVLLGNVLRGIGETPVQPLGISYIDDFATEENAALYVGTDLISPAVEVNAASHL